MKILDTPLRYDPSKKATKDELESARKDKSDDDHDRSHLGSNGTNVMIKFAADRNAPHAERKLCQSQKQESCIQFYPEMKNLRSSSLSNYPEVSRVRFWMPLLH